MTIFNLKILALDTQWLMTGGHAVANIGLTPKVLASVIVITTFWAPHHAIAGSVANSASDHAVVEALLRISNAKLKDYPHQQAVVRRHLDQLFDVDPAQYVKVVRQLGVRENMQRLVEIASGDGQAAIDAANTLLQFGQQGLLRQSIEAMDDRAAAQLASTLGHVNDKKAVSILRQVMRDESRHATVRSAAASGLGKTLWGQQILLEIARADAIPKSLQFEFSNSLLGSNRKEIATAAKEIKALKPLAAGNADPIPPVSRLSRMRGKPDRGKEVFHTIGTCAKCHKVLGEGKEVGPDLSEIGSKLSREAMFVSILNPSAGISHNYETYGCLTVDGQLITGILVSETDEGVTLKTADALLKQIPDEEIEDLRKQEISLMPADLQKLLTVQDLVDLVDYMSLLCKPDEKRFNAVAARSVESPSRKAEDAVLGFEIASGLKVQLLASEPRLLSPTSIDIDHLGRIWVCEVVNYRQFRNPGNKLREQGDRLLVMEDTDGDASIDKTTVFYQGRDIDSAHGICVLGDRVIVSAGENVISFRDVDGDLKPDEKKLMFTGISGAQHDHGIHSFMPGPDGKLYFNFGNEGKQLLDSSGNAIVDMAGNEINSSRQPYQQGMVFRCDLDGGNVETIGWNFRNNWEVCIDSFGNLWQSDNDDDGNRGTRINFVMEFGNYGYRDERNGAAWQVDRIGMRSDIGQRHWHLSDPGVVPNVLQTGAGSPTGMTYYEGDLLPGVFRNQMIHTDPGPNVVRAYPIEKHGAGYKASTEILVQSIRDRWFRPVDVCTAPDGSLVIADWYDPGVGGHRMGDTSRGRLFRVTVPGHESFTTSVPDFTTLAGASDALASPNQSTRFLAGQAIKNFWEQRSPNPNDFLDPSKVESPVMRARWMWLLAKNPATERDAIEIGLSSEEENLRVAAIRAARQSTAVDDLDVVERLIDDRSPQVRRELAIALRGKDGDRAIDLWTKLALQHDGEDRWYLEALGIGADGKWDACFSRWIAEVGQAWNEPRNRDIVWRARTPAACEYLGKLILLSESIADQQRYFRALEFFSVQSQQKALASIVAK